MLQRAHNHLFSEFSLVCVCMCLGESEVLGGRRKPAETNQSKTMESNLIITAHTHTLLWRPVLTGSRHPIPTHSSFNMFMEQWNHILHYTPNVAWNEMKPEAQDVCVYFLARVCLVTGVVPFSLQRSCITQPCRYFSPFHDATTICDRKISGV